MTVLELVKRAYEAARRDTTPRDPGIPDGLTHRRRSSAWITRLAAGFRDAYPDRGEYQVFCCDPEARNHEFRREEFLFDVSVLGVGVVDSPKHKPLQFVKAAIWAVESEFSADTRDAVIDLSKLVMASAEKKLFVGPFNSMEKKYLDTLLPVAEAASAGGGRVLCALLPHPSKWDTSPDLPRLHVLTKGGWRSGDREMVR